MIWRDRLLLLLILAGPAAALGIAWRMQSPSLNDPAAGPAGGFEQPAPTFPTQAEGPTERLFSVTARRYVFDPPRIEVFEGDLVKIELRTLDIAHSFTLDEYRVSKRAGPDQEVSFEFRAEHAGTFPIYCNLQIEEGCRRMRAELVVKPRP